VLSGKPKTACLFYTGNYGAIHNLAGSTASGKTGIDDGTLVIDKGYSAKVESHGAGVFAGILLDISW
jgi:hypothetical protein